MNAPTPGEEAVRRRQGSDQAIQLALESKWEEAVALNRAILQQYSSDVDAWNRLGKALLEVGRYRDASDAYSKALSLDPVNRIAKRNLDRLASIKDTEAPRRADVVAKVAQDLFIEEIGKTGVTTLRGIAAETLVQLTAGDEVYLKAGSAFIGVETAQGDSVGTLEPKLGLRLLRMINGGNRYAAAVKSVGDREVELIIKETYRDPSQTRVSFPSTGEGVGVRPYIKESLLRLGNDDDDDDDDAEVENDDWEAEPDGVDATVSFSSFQNTIERDVDEEESDDDA